MPGCLAFIILAVLGFIAVVVLGTVFTISDAIKWVLFGGLKDWLVGGLTNLLLSPGLWFFVGAVVLLFVVGGPVAKRLTGKDLLEWLDKWLPTPVQKAASGKAEWPLLDKPGNEQKQLDYWLWLNQPEQSQTKSDYIAWLQTPENAWRLKGYERWAQAEGEQKEG